MAYENTGDYYTGSYISSNFDNYQNWAVGDDNSGSETISSTNTLDVIGSTQSNYLGIQTFLSAGDLTLRLDINGLDVAAAVDNSSDYVFLYDNSASKNTKTTPEDLVGATTAITESGFGGANNTMMYKNNSGTVTNFQINEQTIVGRITGGEITALTAGQVQTLLGLGTMAYESTGSYYTSAEIDSGFVAISGTPSNNEIAVWTDSGTIEGRVMLPLAGVCLMLREHLLWIHTRYMIRATYNG